MTFYERPLHHINLMVPNLAKAIDFYTKTLGFKVTNTFKGTMELKGNMEFVFITDGNVTYELLEDKSLENTVFEHIAYVSNDIKADYAHFEALGLTTTTIGSVDFLYENGVEFFFIKGAGNDRIEFIAIK